MLTVTETQDWSMEQHEAAAAALGAAASLLMKVGDRSEAARMDGFTFAKGLQEGQDQAARWLAIDAARHARLAEKAFETMIADALRRTYPDPVDVLRIELDDAGPNLKRFMEDSPDE